jgi:hypothetical protein
MPTTAHRTARTLPLALLLLVTTTSAGASIDAIAAPVRITDDAQRATQPPDAKVLVRTALDRIGGTSWSAITSFESAATVQSAMGDGRIEFQFIAPDARRLVQTMPGGKATLELGTRGSQAWMGEPGRMHAVDPRMAEELAGGGDLITLVRSLDARFKDFTTLGRETIDGAECWKIAMTPVASATPDARWTLYLRADDASIVGLEIPAPPKPASSDAPVQDGQSIRFRRWEPVERGPNAKPGASTLLAFREATIVTSGMKVDLVYAKVAVDTLSDGAIAAPATVAPAPAPARPAAGR